ncbi:MAG: hypothetical protein NTV34_13830, partial [Proteobacteria bacterium]|nr:hypothetical protein [Pseudomonadota bacterium]
FPTLFNTNPGIGAVYPFKANSMRSLTAYSCSADALGNIGDCLSPSNFSFVNESEAGVLNNQTTMANATSFDFYPNKFGTVQIRATKNGFTGTSDVINVGASPLDRFAVQSIATLTNVTIPAGTEIPFKICMKDGGDNTITSDVVVNAVTVTAANGTLPLNISILNIAPNAENSTMQISTGTGGGFASGLIGSGVQNVTFTSGCSYFYAKVLSAGTYNSVPLLQASYTDTNQSNKLVSGMGLIGIDSVTPLSLDHYATVVSSLRGTPLPNSTAAWAAPGTTNTLAAIGGNRFHVLLSARDTHGNNISVTKTVTLGLLEADGTTPIARSPICGAPANDTACLTVNLVGASTSTISNLAVDIGGRNLYISAADGSANLKGAVSTMIYAESSVKTVKNYVVSAPTSVNAGIPTSISVIAKDSSGATVQGADAGLNTLNFVWLDANSNLLTTNHSAPDATPPTVGASKLNFSAGAAFANLTFTKAESGLAINIRDDQTPSIVSGNLTTTVVSPGSTLKYSFSCAMSTGGADCTGTSGAPYVIDASPQSRFNLTVQAYDQYKNPKASGESPPSIRVNRVSGATTVSSLEQTPLTVTYDSSDQVPVDTNNVSGGTLNNLFYRAGNQVVFYDIDPGTSPYTGIYNTVYHSYQPHIDMVYDYSFVNLPTTPTAGNNYTTIRLCARDKAGNIATGIDAALGAQTFTWSGPANAPNGASPSMPPSALTFTSGVTSNLTVAFLKAESFSFGVTDNYAPAVAGVGGIGSGLKRRSRIIPSYDLIVGHALPSNYLISVASSSPAAGAAFNLSLTARDQYNNIATGWTTDNLTFTWSSGASSSISNPKTAGVLSPGVVGAGAKAFTNGVFATAGTPFVLYRSNLTAVAPPESSILTVTGTNNATQSTTPLTQSLTFTPTPSASSGYVKLTSSSAYSGGTVLSGSALAMTTDQTKNFFAHIFDDFGNYKGNTSNVSWTGSSVLSGKLSPSTGNITTLNPTTAGTGVVTADCSGLTVGCVSDSTGAVTVGVGNITKLVFISPTPTTNYTQNVEDCQQLTIQSQDVNSNAVLAATNIPVTFASTGGNGDFYASAGECSTAQGGGDTAVINTSVFHTSSLAVVSRSPELVVDGVIHGLRQSLRGQRGVWLLRQRRQYLMQSAAQSHVQL